MMNKLNNPITLSTWSELIIAYPIEQFRQDLNVSGSQRSMMLARGRVPAKYWPLLQRMAPQRGVILHPGSLEACEIHYQNQRKAEELQPVLPLNGSGHNSEGSQ